MAEFDINSRVFLDLHDVVPDGEFTKQRMEKIERVFIKSTFHSTLFSSIEPSKFVIVPNGINVDTFKDSPCMTCGGTGKSGQEVCLACMGTGSGEKRNPKLLINTSSPDRSISAVIKGFKKIKEMMPDVECVWAYGWGVYETAHRSDPARLAWKEQIQKEMKEAGIVEMGRISHQEIAKLYRKANVFFYPSEFAEIDCISLSKAMAAGAIPVTTDFSAMGDKVGHGGYFAHSKKTKDTWAPRGVHDFAVTDEKLLDEIVSKTIEILKDSPTESSRIPMREWSMETFNWDSISKVWCQKFQS